MRRKQTGPELKLFELDTLRYITRDNVLDTIHYIGLYPERMSPADITFARKSGLLDSSTGKFHLSRVALHFLLNDISYREYAFLLLSKQWIKTTNVASPSVYNEPLLSYLLKEIQTRGRVPKVSFTQSMDEALTSKYSPVPLSNLDSLRYIRGLLLSSELVSIDGEDLIINPIATAIVDDIIVNLKNMTFPTEENEYEIFWNSMSYGFFDILTADSRKIYAAFFPSLVKK